MLKEFYSHPKAFPEWSAVLASLTVQMSNLGGHNGKRSAGEHHHLSNAYINRQSKCMKLLPPVLKKHLSFLEVSSLFTNIITGQIYSEKITEGLLPFEETGNTVYKQFVDEHLNPESTKSIHEPIKKIMLQTCTSAIKAKKFKANDKPKNSEETVICLPGVP